MILRILEVRNIFIIEKFHAVMNSVFTVGMEAFLVHSDIRKRADPQLVVVLICIVFKFCIESCSCLV